VIAPSLLTVITSARLSAEVVVGTAAVSVMLVDAVARPSQRWITGAISIAGLFAAAVSSGWLWSSYSGVTEAFKGMIVLDALRLGFTLVFLLVSFLTVLVSMVWVENEQLPACEFHSLLL